MFLKESDDFWDDIIDQREIGAVQVGKFRGLKERSLFFRMRGESSEQRPSPAASLPVLQTAENSKKLQNQESLRRAFLI